MRRAILQPMIMLRLVVLRTPLNLKLVSNVTPNVGVIHKRNAVPCSSLLRCDFAVNYPCSSTFKVFGCLEDMSKGGITKNTFHCFMDQKEKLQLCQGSQRILNLPNAGGNSVWSEVLSFELLNSLYGATLMRTEMELEYWPMGCKITDYSIQLYGHNIGVSVTRAMKFQKVFTEEDAVVLLKKKLEGVNISSSCVIPEHSWSKQILHVWCQASYVADIILSTFEKLDHELRMNTLVIATVVQNANWIF